MADVSRRRFVSIAAIAGGLCLLPQRPGAALTPVRWQGIAMGADASITLYHPDPPLAQRVIAAARAEIERVEAVFSLFRRDSALVRLNRDGRLDRAPPEFHALLAEARAMSVLSDGAFDVTVQPLWSLYETHFSRAGADPSGPAEAAIRAAAAKVGWADLASGAEAVWFRRPGMAATFNGIAQGFVTDRVAALMRAEGFADVLLNLGEWRAWGGHPDGRPWRVGVADPLAPAALLDTIALRRGAVASSGGYGTMFEPSGRFHHLFDPTRGRPSPCWAGVSVIAPTATLADALSTTLAVVPADAGAAIFARSGATQALLVGPDGRRLTFGPRSNSGAEEPVLASPLS
jgi:thiamine biosynthesis lipoprotein